MPSARQVVVNLLTQAFAATPAAAPVPKVIGYGASVDVTQRTVMVLPTKVTKTPEAPLGARTYEFDIFCIAPDAVPTDAAENALDDLLADVLDALDSEVVPNNVLWSEATRAVYEDKAPAYVVKLTTPFEPSGS